METLPFEIWNLIISYLGVKDRSNLMKINKKLNHLARHLPTKWGWIKNTDFCFLNPPNYVFPIKMSYFIGDLRSNKLIIIDPRAREVFVEFSKIQNSSIILHRNIKKMKIRNIQFTSLPANLMHIDINGEVLTDELVKKFPSRMKYIKLSGLVNITSNFSVTTQRMDIRDANSNSSNINISSVEELLLGDNSCDATIMKTLKFIQINTLDLFFNDSIIYSNQMFKKLEYISFQTIQLGILISLVNSTVIGESLFPNVNVLSIDIFSYSVAPWIQYENLSQVTFFDSFLFLFPNLKIIYLSRPTVTKLNFLFKKNFFIKSKKIEIIACDNLPMQQLIDNYL